MSPAALGPLIQVCGRVASKNGHAVWHGRHDLSRLDDYKVVVGDERKRPASLPGTVVEHDRAGGGDRDRAGGEDSIDPVEIGNGQAAGRRPRKPAAASTSGKSAGITTLLAPCPDNATSMVSLTSSAGHWRTAAR